jgi:hypothetical protein
MPSIESGSNVLFYQATAPVGWTKLTDLNDIGIRITSGTGDITGGSVAFTSCFSPVVVSGTAAAGGSIGAVTLSLSQISSHSHPSGAVAGATSSIRGGGTTAFPQFTPANNPSLIGPISYFPISTPPAGGGFSHTHPAVSSGGSFTGDTFEMSIRYADVIVAQRN